MGLVEDDYRASRIAGRASNFCVPKAILLTAALRAAGIPAAVGFGDVKNHLNSPKLSDLMGTDLFIYHGYVALWLKQSGHETRFFAYVAACIGVSLLVYVFTADTQKTSAFHADEDAS